MKKIFVLLVSAMIAAQSLPVWAEEGSAAETAESAAQAESHVLHDSVKMTLALKSGFCHSADGQAVFEISDGEKSYTKIVDIGNSKPSQEVTFFVDAYTEGKVFTITPVSGLEAIFVNGERQDGTTVMPAFSLENGQETQNQLIVEYIPSFHNALNVVLNGKTVDFPQTARNIGEHVIVPMKEMAEALELTYTYQNGVYTASSPVAVVSYDANSNAFFVEKRNTGRVQYIPDTAAQNIGGVQFVPIALFGTAYNLTFLMEQTGEKPTLYIATAAPAVAAPNNGYVNSSGLGSETDYLVWISKSEYKVHVYMGSKGNWNEIKTFTCGIGAPRTPTCEGTYRYYQAQTKWDYGTYYVGPVMRFNGGYAIHSTLLYPNGTPMDNRVGIRLSHGCIRLRPDDIAWMFYYVPLRTTIHITG